MTASQAGPCGESLSEDSCASSSNAVYTSPSYLRHICNQHVNPLCNSIVRSHTGAVSCQNLAQSYDAVAMVSGRAAICKALNAARLSASRRGAAPADGAVELVVIEAKGVHERHSIRPRLTQSLHESGIVKEAGPGHWKTLIG